MELIDSSFKIFENLVEEIKTYDHSIFSEQDTRVKIIDRILTDVLNVHYDQFTTEVRAGNGFIDYKINQNNIPRLVIEAKRDGIDFEIDRGYSGRAFNLNGPVFKDIAIKSGLDQAIYYCAYKGVELACLTNGKTWIIFRANRLGDGKDVLEGKGFVFSTLELIKKDFKLFYDLLSPEGIDDLRYRAIFQEAEGDQIRKKDFSKSIVDEDNVRLADKSNYSQDFDKVMNEFFFRLTGDTDPEMLSECFVETKESQAAEFNLTRISDSIIHRVKSLETKESEILKDLIEKIQTTNKHEFVILIGGKGAGKSTFVERFFKFVLPQKLKEACIVIKINLSESDGDPKNIVNWLNYSLIEEGEKVLYNGKPTFEQIKGMFYFEYDRLRTGAWRELYEKDKSQFNIDFGKHIETRRENMPTQYIKRMIGDITKSRFKVPCIIFDNTDHYSIEFQDAVFQYARSIYEKEICLMIIPITDKTSWQLSKQGAIQSFENEALFLPTPSPKKIIEKRIDYLEKKLTTDSSTKGEYFLQKGIRLEIQNIEAFVKYLQGIFLREETVAQWIGNFSNYDIRRCLELTRDLISSPHLRIDEFLKLYFSGNKFEEEEAIKPYRIKNALIKRFSQCYPINNHKFIQNLFYLTSNVNTSPILSMRILQVLIDRKSDQREDNYISTDQTLDYFTAMGVDRSVTFKHLNILLKSGLILSYDPTILEITDSRKVEISSSGFEHYLWSLNDNEYLYAMLEVTSITENELYLYFERNYYYWKERNSVMIEFLEYLRREDSIYCHIPEHAAYKGQHTINKRLDWRIKVITNWIMKNQTKKH